MSRNETICLIVEHIVNKGYNDVDAFVNYITTVLPNMSDLALQYELEGIEENV